MQGRISIMILLFVLGFLSVGLCSEVFAQDTSITFISSLNIRARALDGDGRYIYVGGDGIKVVEYTDPYSPSVIGVSDPPDCGIDDIDVEGNYAHIVGAYGCHASVIDISDPADLNLTSYYLYDPYPYPIYLAWGIHVYDTLAFINGCPDGMYFPLLCYNISDPANPKLLSRFLPSSQLEQMCKVGDLVYVVGWLKEGCFGPGLHVVDYTDPSNPVLLGQSCEYDAYAFGSVAVRNNYAYVAQGMIYLQMYLAMLDVSDPENPYLVGVFDTTEFDPWEMVIKGDHAFTVGLNSGVHILDLSDPVEPRIIASHPVYAWEIYVEGQLLFVASNDSLVILRAGFLPAGPGDVDNNGAVSVTDVVYLINYLFRSGPEPYWLNSADVNANCETNIVDVVYLINYLFKSGPALKKGCVD